MTDSTYTAPALRDAANKLRTDATTYMADAELKARQLTEDARRLVEEARQVAEQMRADAARIDELAEQERGPQSAERPCPNCGLPMVFTTGLGWQHADLYAACGITVTDQRVATAGPGETGPMPATQDGGPQE